MLRYSLLPAVACAMLAALLAPPPCFAQPKSPYIWPGGPPNDPNWIMIGVWYQSYSTTRLNQYQSIGLTSYICPTTPTSTDLANLRNRGFKLFTDQKSSLLTITNGGTIAGWNQVDEPDNAQLDPNYSQTVYGPCIDPNIIVARYNAMKAADPNRPVYLGLGQGVCWPITQQYYGRGSGATWSQYPIYCQGGDIICFDVYPYNARTTDPTYRNPWYVAVGVDRLRSWTNYSKPIWVHIETTNIRGNGGPRAYQTKAEVWMALVHGAVGIDYFAHSWYPTFKEDAIFSTDPNTVDPNMPGMLAQLNAQIKSLAPILYEPAAAGYLDPNGAVNWVLKDYQGYRYLFAVAMREANNVSYTFTVPGVPLGATGEVLFEDRSAKLTNGSFSDDFSRLAVHLYRFAVPEPASAALLAGGLAWFLRRGRRRG